jgi:hypothetical protein
MIQIKPVTRDNGYICEPEWLESAETVHRQLRPQMPPDYLEEMCRIFAGGARMIVAVDGRAVLGLGIWRRLEKTYSRTELYIDDLVTDESQRSKGVGHELLTWLEAKARELGCDSLCLDSGTQRHDAHRFYFRERMTITSFHFRKAL